MKTYIMSWEINVNHHYYQIFSECVTTCMGYNLSYMYTLINVHDMTRHEHLWIFLAILDIYSKY